MEIRADRPSPSAELGRGWRAPSAQPPSPRSLLRHDLQNFTDVGRGAEVGDVERAVGPDRETRRVIQPSLRVDYRARAAWRDADDRARPAEERRRRVLEHVERSVGAERE